MKTRNLTYGFTIAISLILLSGCCGAPTGTRVSDSIVHQIVIEKPRDQVWAYMFVEGVAVDDQGHVTVEWAPAWECDGIEGLGSIGQVCRSTLTVDGHKFRQNYVMVESVPNVIFTQRDGGDEDDILSYVLADHERGTRLIMVLQYSLDLPPGVGPAEMKSKVLEMVADMASRVKKNVESREVSKEALAVVAAGEKISTLNGTNTWTVEIKAPVEKVFAFITDPATWPQWHDDSAKIDNIAGKGLGQTNDWVVSAGGISFQGQSLIVDYEPNVKQVEIFSGDVQGTNTWLFLPGDGVTKVIYLQNASISSPGMTRAQWDGLMKASQDAGEKELQKAKKILER